MYCQRQHLGQISTSKRRVGLELWRTFAEFLKMHKDTHMGGILYEVGRNQTQKKPETHKNRRPKENKET